LRNRAPGATGPRGNDKPPAKAPSSFPILPPLYDGIHAQRCNPPLTGPLHLGRRAYLRAVGSAVMRKDLRLAEGVALLSVARRIGRKPLGSVPKWQRCLLHLARQTKPDRVSVVGAWVPFDPNALLRASRRFHEGKVD
jgi:hypothetical protein